MLRSTLIAAGAAVLCSAGFAQQSLDASKVYPITSPVKDAGVFNANTNRWISPANFQAQQNAVGFQWIFDNRCTYTVAAYYTGTGSCETYIDEGEIPGSDNLDFSVTGYDSGTPGVGASADNNVIFFQIGYCTNVALPNLTIGFYDTLGGQCGGIAPSTGNGQPTLAAQACPAAITAAGMNPQSTAYYNMAAAGIPGDATPGGGGVSCWIVGTFLGNVGFCLKSEGDGVWDNDADLDRFNWSWEMNDALTAPNAPGGVILSGEPASLPNPIIFGACTYNLPCDADALTGATCGTGRGADDGFWINVDGDKADGTTNTGVTCLSAPGAGTTCYWFGGWPGNPYGSFWMLMAADGGWGYDFPEINGNGCTGQTAPSCNGCMSTVSWTGLPNRNFLFPSVFKITFANLNGNVNGVVFYGISGRVNVPWSSGSNLCIKSPTQRLNGYSSGIGMNASGNTGGVSGTCGGMFSFDFNPIINGTSTLWLGQVGALPNQIPSGTPIDMQAWTRDACNPKTTILSQKLHFDVLP